MEAELLALEPVRRAAAAARGGALEADLDGQIQDDGKVGPEIADRHPLHCIDEADRHAAEATLIGPRRIRETVAQHPNALPERRLDHCADMVVAGGCEK